MNIRFKTMNVPDGTKIVPGVASYQNDEYSIFECDDQAEALGCGEIFWSHLTAKEKESCVAFYAGWFICDDEGKPDISQGAWFICDWLGDPEEVTFYKFNEVPSC